MYSGPEIWRVMLLTYVVPIALMCVLTSAYSKELAILPAIMALVFVGLDALEVAFATFVIIAIFTFASRLVSNQTKG